MIYVPIPVAMLELGKPLPIDVWDPAGKLLLRKGQPILSAQHREMLNAHQASMTETDARAWQKSYERMIHTLLAEGADVDVIANACLPTEIWEADYVVGKEVLGGWLDLQEILRGLLYQGEAAISPLQRLAGIEQKAFELLKSDPDECLFVLFQALADTALGYCATHALLCAVVCELTGEKLGLAEAARRVLFRSALVMNIGMARAQDSLTRQSSILNDAQRKLIREHPQKSVGILQHMGVTDEEQLDIVRWHHELDESCALASTLQSRRILRTADSFVAKMAARKTRLAMSPLGATKSMFLEATEENARLGSAMATAVGFYPPGTYVQLVNGEKAVSVARGLRANNPHVVSIVSPGNMPLSKYLYRDTTDPRFAIRAPLNAEKIKVKVSLEKVQKELKELKARSD
jgi:HD-GYP domain-containing protein (c-di-GMP phosphodiesterase class II)